jgi:hypothetical protein
MIFRPELIPAVLSGEKTETRRPVSDNPRSPWWRERCKLQPGHTYAACPGRGKSAVARIRVTHWLVQESLYMIDDAGARREGFRSRDAFLAYFARLHGEPPTVEKWSRTFLEQRVWVVRFELAP